ncbi:lipase family protein [Phytopseudomonas dryadis]|uniref:Lipase n=1 Tax=Phytopseudomonas dryadis TaxID=2487520 RepID=A0A4Q9R2R5_9GAMM|nr:MULTISPECIES: lipase family protein [Pseudomonas]TBU92767.1 lipase [Pseudomonas dryadis]TBV03259.1 lipase [Pseudomonas dryadis]TBV16367.1 lipase [Pseudomonas sp. FRB 230]
MNPLTPKQSASIAKNVYLVQTESMNEVYQSASISGLGDLFDFKGGQKSDGTSGAIFRTRTGFAYAANGIGGRQGEILLAFRGTDIAADWATDANAGLQRGPSTWSVHAGFNETFKSLRADIDTFMRGRNPSTVHCVGHSLGGALATLAADHLSELGVAGVKLYTFGSPRAGVSGFARHLTGKLGSNNIHRVYHNADPVSMVPIFPFNHVPIEGNVCMLPWNGGSFAFAAHKMDNYMASIGDSAWAGLYRNPEPPLARDIDIWLESASYGGTMHSATTLWMISRAMQYLLKKAANVVIGSVITAGMTILDQIAGILVQGAQICKDISDSLRNLIAKIFNFLGRAVPSTADITTAFLRWVLDLLARTVVNMARQAMQLVFRA